MNKLNIPTALVGTQNEVNKQVQKYVDGLLASGKLIPSIDRDVLLIGEINAGNGAARTLYCANHHVENKVHFRPYTLPRTISDKLEFNPQPQIWSDLFDVLAQTPWGILCILCHDFVFPRSVISPKQFQFFFSRLVMHWELYKTHNDFIHDRSNTLKCLPMNCWNFPSIYLADLMVMAGVPADSFKCDVQKKTISEEKILQLINQFILRRKV